MKAPRVYPNEYVLNEVSFVNERESVFVSVWKTGLNSVTMFFFGCIFTVEDFDKAGLA